MYSDFMEGPKAIVSVSGASGDITFPAAAAADDGAFPIHVRKEEIPTGALYIASHVVVSFSERASRN